MATARTGTVFVEIRPDLSRFDSALRAELQRSFKAAEAESKAAVSAIERDVRTIATDTERAARSAGKLGEESAKTVERSFTKAAAGAKKGVASIERDTAAATKRVAKTAEKGVLAGIRDGIQSIGTPEIIIAVVAAAAAAAPLVGAILSTAVIGAVGGFGLAAGIKAAAQSPEVKKAAADLQTTLTDAISFVGGPFIAPLLKSFDTITSRALGLSRGLQDALKPLALAITPLTDGVTGFVEALTPGLKKAFEGALPALVAFADELPLLGSVVGDFFAEIATNENTLRAFIDIIHIVDGAILVLADIIKFLTNAFVTFEDVSSTTLAALSKLANLIPGLRGLVQPLDEASRGLRAGADEAQNMRDKTDQLGEAFLSTKGDLEDFADAFKDLNGANRTLFDAQKDTENSLARFRDSLKKNGTALGLNSQAARDNSDALEEVIKNAASVSDIRFDETKNTDAATKAYNDYIAAARQSVIATGGNVAEFDKFIQQFGRVPQAAELARQGLEGVTTAMANLPRQGLIDVRANTGGAVQGLVDVASRANGVGQLKPTVDVQANTGAATTAINRFKALLASIDTFIDVTVNVLTIGLDAGLRALVGRRASGGPVTAGAPFIVGEKGPELFVPNVSGNIVPSVSSGRPGAAGGFNFGPGAINISFNGVVPTTSEATRTGEAVAAGIAGALARRDLRLAVRAV